jgi:hypothetical protein
MGIGDGSPLQKYKRWQLRKIERNPQQQIWKKWKYKLIHNPSSIYIILAMGSPHHPIVEHDIFP